MEFFPRKNTKSPKENNKDKYKLTKTNILASICLARHFSNYEWVSIFYFIVVLCE